MTAPTVRSIDPAFVRDEALQSVKDHIEQLSGLLPPSGDQLSSEGVLCALKGGQRVMQALYRLDKAQMHVEARVEACQARRGMVRDLVPSNWAWAELLP